MQILAECNESLTVYTRRGKKLDYTNNTSNVNRTNLVQKVYKTYLCVLKMALKTWEFGADFRSEARGRSAINFLSRNTRLKL